MLFLTPKCFTFVNIEWGSGVFQGIVAAVVGVNYGEKGGGLGKINGLGPMRTGDEYELVWL